MTSRRWVVAALIVTVAVGTGTFANLRRADSIGRGGSKALAEGQPLGITDALASFRIDYKVEERIGDDVRISTDKLWVRRPFDSRLETWTDAPPGRRRLSREIVTLGRSSTVRSSGDALISDQPPGVATADTRLTQSLPGALRGRVLERRERRRVTGRVCQVYRTRGRFASGVLQAPTRKEFVDTCVDGDGLLLEEVQVTGGKRETRRVAVSVELRPVLTDDVFAVGPPNLDVPHGGGSTRRVDPASTPPGQFWQLDAPPPGFTLVGRYGVVPPQPENFTDPLREAYRRAALSDVYRNGNTVLIVERGATLRGAPPWPPEPANPAIELGELGRGEVVLGTRGAEVRAITGGGRYVRVFGTLPPDDLAAIARQLHLVPGGQLKYLD